MLSGTATSSDPASAAVLSLDVVEAAGDQHRGAVDVLAEQPAGLAVGQLDGDRRPSASGVRRGSRPVQRRRTPRARVPSAATTSTTTSSDGRSPSRTGRPARSCAGDGVGLLVEASRPAPPSGRRAGPRTRPTLATVRTASTASAATAVTRVRRVAGDEPGRAGGCVIGARTR